ncbi:MAG: hypothetical protein KAS39_05215, partial [Actinomycetia bacterium]|nr:hypothetical protein [Actinomycetes bacterium]
RGITPHHSTAKSGVMRGIGAEVVIGPANIGLFYSQMWYDATIEDQDADDNDHDNIRNEFDPDDNNDGIPDTNDNDLEGDHDNDCFYGLHSALKSIVSGYEDFTTESATRKRNRLAERLIGAHFDINIKQILTVGFNASYSQYWQRQYLVYERKYHPGSNQWNPDTVVFDPELKNDRYYAFRGNQLVVSSLYFDLFLQNVNIYGAIGTSFYPVKSYQAEFQPDAVHNSDPSIFNPGKLLAKDNSEVAFDLGLAGVLGVYLDFKLVRLSSLFYNISPNYYAPHGNIFADDKSEMGFFQGCFVKLSSKYKFTFWMQIYKKNWRTYDYAQRLFYTKFEFLAEMKPWRKFLIKAKIRFKEGADSG